ncbi:MAG: amino acid permease [Candidatus Baldrarchaeia archaeon]
MATEKIFIRKASGLVRSVSGTDAFFFNLFASGPIGFALAWSVYWAFYGLPGANLWLAMAYVTIFSIFLTMTYAMLSSVMPRAGGDYVFISRTLHPAIGFAANWNMMLTQFLWGGAITIFFVVMAISPVLGTLGIIFGNTWLLNAAKILSTSAEWIFGIGILVIIIVGVVAVLGLKRLMWFLRVGYVLGFLSLAIILGTLLATNNQTFVEAFNMIAAEYSISYQGVIDAAKEAGLSIPTTLVFDPKLTIAAMAVGFAVISWSWWSIYIAGEIVKAEDVKRQILIMVGPTVLNGILYIASIFLMYKVIGYEFLAAAYYLFDKQEWAIPVPPFINFFVAVILLKMNNPILAALCVIGFLGWPLGIFALGVPTFSRCMFAWGMDRLLPERITKISRRWNTPVNSIIVTTIVLILSTIFVALLLETGIFWHIETYVGLAPIVGTIAIVCLTGALLPYTRRDLYEKAAISKFKIGSIPLITIIGIISTAFTLFIASLYFFFPALGLADPLTSAIVCGTIFGSGLVYFYAVKYYRKKQGIDLDLLYREIPPA